MNLKKFLKDASLVGVISLCLLLVMNFVAFLFLWTEETPSETYFTDRLGPLNSHQLSAYSHMSNIDVNDMLNHTWNAELAGWQYESWLGFREKTRASQFVNVSEQGFRINHRGSGEIDEFDKKIWFFGGSTTFGYGVADWETIPSYLENISGIKTINFGRGYYNSKQENLLFQELLVTGNKPVVAIFLDGINERCDLQIYQDEMKILFNRAQATYKYVYGVEEFFYPALLYSSRFLRKYLGFTLVNGDKHSTITVSAKRSEIIDPNECMKFGVKVKLSDALEKQMEFRKSLCEGFAVKCQTFIQPFAGEHGVHLDYKSFPEKHRGPLKQKFYNLEMMWKRNGAKFVTTALDELEKHGYVDNVHYSATANSLIAEDIYALVEGDIRTSSVGTIRTK